MKRVHEYLEHGERKRNLALSARKDVVSLYKRFGYGILSWNVVGYIGKPKLDLLKSFNSADGIQVIDITEDNIININRYDRKFFPYDREGYLKFHINRDDSKAVAAVSESGDILGYGIITVASESHGFHIGPLYAESVVVAKVLMKELCLAQPEVAHKGVFLEGAEPNVNMNLLAEFANVTEQYKLRRQYTLTDVQLPLQHVYSTANTDVHTI